MTLSVVDLAKQLIEKPSVTPEDKGCIDIIIEKLNQAGFACEKVVIEDVTNLWASHGQAEGPTLCLVGHTDVVPTGDESNWLHPPFKPTVVGDALYGRGACDMKGALAAMVVSAIEYVKAYPQHKGRLALLITSDEEGPALNGIRQMVSLLQEKNERIDYCLVGEPSSDQRLGDIIKIGRRGSLNAQITIKGQQGHVAYPHLAKNPIHQAFEAFNAAVHYTWDKGHPDFPNTSLQFSNIKAGTGAENVIPGQLSASLNFRYNPSASVESLQTQLEALLKNKGLEYDIDWRHSGEPCITSRESQLIEALQGSLTKHLGFKAELSTDGGTSDGRFVAQMGADVVELGPINATIHQVNEWVSVQSLIELSAIYFDTYKKILAP